MDCRFKKLAPYLGGWMNYYGISEYYRSIPEIDHWLRRRIRRPKGDPVCYWKQWRYARTKIRNLLKLGTHPGVAIPDEFEPERSMERLQNPCDANRYDHAAGVTQGSGSRICQRTMGENPLSGHA